MKLDDSDTHKKSPYTFSSLKRAAVLAREIVKPNLLGPTPRIFLFNIKKFGTFM